jgi:hypothetical protein
VLAGTGTNSSGGDDSRCCSLAAAPLRGAAGQQLTVVPQVDFVKRPLSRGRAALVPTSLPRLPLRPALATITLPRT